MNAVPHSTRLFWIAGIALLIATVLGASFVLNGANGSHPGSGEKPGDTPEIRGVSCIGLVETDPGVINLNPVMQGRITFVVEEGKFVDKEGAVLLKLDDRQAKFQVRLAEADVTASRAQLELAELLPDQLKKKAKQQQAAIEGATAEKGVAEADQRIKEKLWKNVPPSISIEEKLAADKRVEALTAKVDGEKFKLEEINLANGQAQIGRAKADLAAKEARLDEAKLALAECEVVAPCPGTVLRVLVHKGEILSSQAKFPAIQFAPKGVKIIRAEVLQEWASQVAVDQKVDIVDDTYAGSHWAGKVKRVSEWQALTRHIMLEPFIQNDVRTLECIITVEEKADAPLRIGQRVRALIQTGK